MSNTVTAYRYNLDKGSKKFKCPNCGQKTFVLYIDGETSEYMPGHVGRCDREQSCCHHYTPKQYLAETGQPARPYTGIIEKPYEPPKVDFIPANYMQQSKAGGINNTFSKYLISLFGFDVAANRIELYNIGRSTLDSGNACLFWQVDINGNVRSGKIVAYNDKGKRLKEAEAMATGRGLRDYEKNYVACQSVNPVIKKALGDKTLNYEQCFFGEHLLSRYPDKPVSIVESEKTAIICSVFMPGRLWLATGGQNGCKWRDYAVFKVLEGRRATWFPDYGFANKQKAITCYESWSERVRAISGQITGTFSVSDILEKQLQGQPRNDEDLADMLIKPDEETGIALNDAGYPVLWDINYSDLEIKTGFVN